MKKCCLWGSSRCLCPGLRKAKHRVIICCLLPPTHGPVSLLFITTIIAIYHYYYHLHLSVVQGTQQESSSHSLHAVQHTKEGVCFIQWFKMGYGGWETIRELKGQVAPMAMDFSKQLTSLVCFVAITHQVGTVVLQGPQQQSLCCLFFCFCKVFPGLFAKLFELRGTRTTLALGVCITPSGPKLGQMPVVFIASPVIALRSLPTDPTDTKLFCSVLIMQKTTLTITPHRCLCSKLVEQHKKRAALGWMKQRDLMEISSEVFSYLHGGKASCRTYSGMWGTESSLVPALPVSVGHPCWALKGASTDHASTRRASWHPNRGKTSPCQCFWCQHIVNSL